jgi:hypothetical protein
VDRSTELRLPTVAVPVRLALVGRDVAPAELCVADEPRPGRSALIDAVAELLDSATSFVPVRAHTRVRLLGKHAVAWIAVARRDPEAKPSTEFQTEEPSEVFTLYDRQHRVEIELVAGTRLLGTLLDSSPSDRPRVVDYLNGAAGFVRLWTPEEHILINKTQIISVTELPGSDA